jgi:hypothetical protein
MKLKINALLFIITMCLTSSLATITLGHASPETRVSVINPATKNGMFTFYTDTVNVGHKFKVTFNVSAVINMALWQVSLQFNPTHINCLNVSIPTENIFKGKVVIAPDPVIDNTGGILVYGATVFPTVGVSGSGVLCEAWFEIKSAPPKGQTLTSTLQLITEDTFTTKLEDPEGNPIPYTPENGTYQYISPPIEEPTLEVQPEIHVANKKGEIFDVNVTLNNLNRQWELIAVEFKLRFNPAVLHIINVVEGPFIKQFPQPGYTSENATIFVFYDDTVYGYDYVIVGVILWPEYDEEGNAVYSVFPEGSGTVATITFNVTGDVPQSFPLELYDVLLLDKDLGEIPYKLKHGLFDFPIELLTHEIVWVDPVTGQTHTFMVETASNSSISQIEFSQTHRYLTFTVTGPSGTTGFCNISIPKTMLYAEPDQWLVLIEGWPVNYTTTTNNTHTWIYFTYSLTTKKVYIFGLNVIPEFQINIYLAASLVVTALLITTAKKKSLQKRKPQPIVLPT